VKWKIRVEGVGGNKTERYVQKGEKIQLEALVEPKGDYIYEWYKNGQLIVRGNDKTYGYEAPQKADETEIIEVRVIGNVQIGSYSWKLSTSLFSTDTNEDDLNQKVCGLIETDDGYLISYVDKNAELARIDSSGNVLWKKSEGPCLLAESDDGGYYTACKKTNVIEVSRFYTNDSLKWRMEFQPVGDDNPVSFIKTSDGGCLIAVTSNYYNAEARNKTYLIKLNSSGGVE
jgi:hypothetical protein